MNYKIQRRYEKFLARLEYTPSLSDSIPIFKFRDCLNLGYAFALNRSGHSCILKNLIILSAVKSVGFSDKEIELLFSVPKVSRRRKSKCVVYSKVYRKNKGSISHIERRKLNLEQFRKICKLRERGYTRSKIANELTISLSRVRYLLYEFKNS